jgi:pyrroloquinoline quinone biosynthesis protein B
VRVKLLGTAAGGGIPQWNCSCTGCQQARRYGSWRAQDTVAISGDERAWYMLNASPDLRAQLLGAPELAPGPGRRQTPVRGVLLSTAELDHTIGLLMLREAEQLEVYGTAAVLDALTGCFPVRQILGCYTEVCWHVVSPADPVELAGGLLVNVVPVGTKRPRYASTTTYPGREQVVAYRITDRRTGGTLVYAPCLAAIDEAFLAAVKGADCIMLDGTFLHDDEMARSTGGGRLATEMGHLPIADSLPRLAAATRARIIYTHLNNTNPVAALDTPDRDAITAGGAEVGEDGQTFTL